MTTTTTTTPRTTRQDEFPFIHRLRVRWQEVDAQNVVFNGHYLGYLDVAVSEYWRAVSLPYPDGLAHLDGDVFVRQNSLAYHAPARLDDWLDIGVRCAHIGNSSLRMAWAVWAGHRLLVTGETVYVFTSLQSGRPQAVPEVMRRHLQAQAQGEATTAVRLGPWAQLGAPASALRRLVFIEEQGVPEHEEWDADDAHALHAVIDNLAGLPLATARLITRGLPAGEGRIGRMAVRRPMRGMGLGRVLLRTLLQAAADQGCRQVSLHAQTAARRFYEAEGFVAQGEVFDEVGIPHIAMVRALGGELPSA